MDTFDINRRNIATMLFGLYEKEAFQISTDVKEVECGAWGGFYEMDVTTAKIEFNDHNSFTTYGNFLTKLIKEMGENVEKDPEIYQKWKEEILQKADELDTMEEIRRRKAK